MSNCTKCCSKKTLKLPSRKDADGNNVPFSKSCPGDGSNANADLCAIVQDAIACAPSNLVKRQAIGNGVVILSNAATKDAIVQGVFEDVGCPGKFIPNECVRAQIGKSGCLKIDTSKKADGTDASIVDAASLEAAGCNLDRNNAIKNVSATSANVRTCTSCK